jgi:hypothetical protein
MVADFAGAYRVRNQKIRLKRCNSRFVLQQSEIVNELACVGLAT